ncbi:flagellar basal body-associated FliL family protein [Aquabacter sp. L1I39]|uniref:flagellar basal body-associated FliL family protein n=1 Tax=Aquabacter sp. L1I39 TaxID=2820278 RepID=UPI001ADB60BE|nr:flagellar basal body-associated FliL family protein [Aquabacter sp. L1I39]QTL04327.1 flagellar basal body-associated FliL family protein [Aquabacter sp. L1I39]
MAKEKAAKPQTEGEAPKKGGGAFIAVLILTLLAGAGGGGLGYKMAGTVEHVVEARIAAEPPKKEEKPLNFEGDLGVQDLKPVVVNLAAPSSTFVRIEGALIYKNGVLPNPAATAAEVREDIMAYMRTISLSQLEGPSALQHLREDLNERAQVRGHGKVKELVLETLVVQ